MAAASYNEIRFHPDLIMDASASPPLDSPFLRSKKAGWGAIALLLLFSGLVGYLVADQFGMRALRDGASHRLDLLASAVDSEVTRLTHIPGVLSLNADILDILRAPPAERPARQAQVNRYLDRLSAQHVDSLAVFVMDRSGLVVASSDWIYSDNLLGSDLSRRPFFQEALSGAPYRQFAVDDVRDEPGYFFAQPIRDELQDWKIVGVAVLKASIRGVERRWLANDAPALIADGNGIVLLSAPTKWRYATLNPLPEPRLRELVRLQFDGRNLGSVSLGIDLEKTDAGSVVRFFGAAAEVLDADALPHSYFVMSRNLPGTAWQLLVLSDVKQIRNQALVSAVLAASGMACMVLWMLYLRQRRRMLQTRLGAQAVLEVANRELEKRVVTRTADLSRTVETLEAEVLERMQAEQTLRSAQEELVQAGKLAVLGRLATSITHELNQPLGAVRTLSGNAISFMHRGDIATAEKNLRIVCNLADQMGGIIHPLKTFARKSPAVPSRVDVALAVGNALFLLDQPLSNTNVEVINQCVVGEHFSWCDANRLQQVLINLIGNAADAMHESDERLLIIDSQLQADGRVALTVADTGCGLPEDALDRIFEPFFTTKDAGDGLGLGLAISRDIVRDFGGELLAENRAATGAKFVIILPAENPTADATGA